MNVNSVNSTNFGAKIRFENKAQQIQKAPSAVHRFRRSICKNAGRALFVPIFFSAILSRIIKTSAGIAADTFVKGLSKPEKALEEKITGEDSFIRGNDEGCNPCDWAATDEYHEDPSECCDCSCD